MDIVVGVDDSPSVETVLGTAIEEAELKQATLHVVHVVQIPSIWAAGMTVMPMDFMDNAAELTEKLRQQLWDRVRSMIDKKPLKWIQVDRTGYPPDQLVDYARSVDAGLLVVGNRGFGDVKSLLLGSTSHRVSHLSPCNVLIVKAIG